MNDEEFGAYIGIDWADRKHDVCLRAADATRSVHLVLKHSPEEIEEWAQGLMRRFSGQKLAVCLEQSRGALIAALLKYDFFVLFPVNPKTLAKYREAFTPSGAKDDPTDAEYLRELVETQRGRLSAWHPLAGCCFGAWQVFNFLKLVVIYHVVRAATH